MDSAHMEINTRLGEPSDRERLYIAIRATALFFILSSVYGVLAFRNFSAFVVVGLQVAVLSLPAVLLLKDLKSPWRSALSRSFPTAPETLFPALVAIFLVGLQLDALVRWDAYFANFAFERLDAGGGYHRDSVFHIAVVQNILTHGLPSTGQHETPFLTYHFLSYYFDAALIRIFGIDALESYALLFFSKTSVVLISLLYFFAAVIPSGSRRNHGLVLVFGTLSFVAAWAVVGSHTYWVPITALLLSGPWIHRLLQSALIRPSQFVALSGLVVLLTLGKGSIGLAFSATLGILLLLQRRSLASMTVVSVWVGWLSAWGYITLGTSGASSRASDIRSIGDVVDRLLNHGMPSGSMMSSVLLLAGALIYLGRRRSSALALQAGLSILLAFFAVAVLASVIATGSDGGYFLMGVFHVGFVVGVPALFDPKLRDADASQSQLVVVLTLSIILAPIAFGSYGDPLQSLRTAIAGNTVTYQWSNLVSPSGQEVSVSRIALGSGHGSVAERAPTVLETARDAIDQVIAEQDLERGEVFLFVPKEAFDQLEHELGIAATSSWNPASYNGLLLTAVTGLPLIYGIPQETHWRYGFGDYAMNPGSARQRSSQETPLDTLCGHGRAVVILADVALPSVGVQCLLPPGILGRFCVDPARPSVAVECLG